MARPPSVRPRFEVRVPLTADEVTLRLKDGLDSPGFRCSGAVARRHAELTVGPDDAHFWSPHLSLEVTEDGDTAVLNGRYGPHPQMWTLFVVFYAFVAFSTLFGLMFGLSQWMSDGSPWALWSVPIGAVLWLLIYLAALFGQRLGDDQMVLLRDFVNGVLEGSFIP